MHKYFSYTPADDSLTGFKSNATGASWPLTTTTPGDDLAHLVTIRNDSATDHSLKTAVLTGTNADDKPITETVALPNNAATVTSTKFFKTLTSVVPSATIGADTMDIGWKDSCVGPSYKVSNACNSFAIGFSVDISGTINYDVEHTMDEVLVADASNGCVWFNHASVAAKTADADGSYLFPIRAMRLAINSLTSGATAKLSIVQGAQ